MARNVVDELVVRLTADASRLQAELGKAETGAQSSGKKIGASFGAAFRQASQLGLAAVTGITAVSTALVTAANKAAAYADEIDKTAIRTRLSRGALQELAFAADQAGVPFTALEANIRAFTGRLAEAERGSATVTGTFDRLGVALRDQNGELRDTESLFLDTIEALSGIDNESTRAALAVQAFGEQGSALLPFLSLGAGGLDALRAKAQELGIVLDDQSINSLVAYKDQLSAVQQQFGSAGREIALQFLPLLTDGLLPALQAALGVFRNLPEPVQRGATALGGLGVAGAAAAVAVRALGGSLLPLFGPAGLIIGGSVALVTLALAMSGGDDSLTKAVGEANDALASGSTESLTGALDTVIDKVDGPVRDSLTRFREDLIQTGTVGVEQAQRIAAALAQANAPALGIQARAFGSFAPVREAFQGAGVPFSALESALDAANFVEAIGLSNDVIRRLRANPNVNAQGLADAVETFVGELQTLSTNAFQAALGPLDVGFQTGAASNAGTGNGTGNGGPAGTDTDPVVVTFSRTATPVLFNEQRLAAQQGANGIPRDARTDFPAISNRGRLRGDGGLSAVRDAERALRDLANAADLAATEGFQLQTGLVGQQIRDELLAGIDAGAVSDRGRTRGDGGLSDQLAIELERRQKASADLRAAEEGLQLQTGLLGQQLAAEREARRAALLAGIGAGAVSDRGRTRGDGGLGAGTTPFGVITPPTVPPEIQNLIDVGAKVRLELERGAQATELAAQETKRAIITAGVQFATNLASAIKSGSPSGIFGALTGGIGSLVGISNPFAGGLIGILGSLFAGFLPDGRDSSDAARAAGATPGGAPSIELNLSVFQNLAVNSLTGGDRAAVDGLLDQTVSRIESVLVSFGQRLTAVEARTA